MHTFSLWWLHVRVCGNGRHEDLHAKSLKQLRALSAYSQHASSSCGITALHTNLLRPNLWLSVAGAAAGGLLL